MTRDIHPSAQITGNVELEENVRVGPFAVLEGPCVVGTGSVIHAHAMLRPYVRLGANNQVHPHAVLGGLPQDLSFQEDLETWLDIANGNVFREGVTVSRATRAGSATRIGSNCYFMASSHVAHDCQVGDGVIFANGAALGGFVQVGDRVFVGGGAMIHQFCRVGTLSMVGGLTGIRKDVLPFTLISGDPPRHYRLNSVGLRRAGIDGANYRVLNTAFRRLRFRKGLDGLPDTPQLTLLRTWLASQSIRGLSAFIVAGKEI